MKRSGRGLKVNRKAFRDFVTVLSTLVRISGNFSRQKKLDLIYANTRPEYKLLVGRQDFAILSQLTEKAEEYEAFLKLGKRFDLLPFPR